MTHICYTHASVSFADSAQPASAAQRQPHMSSGATLEQSTYADFEWSSSVPGVLLLCSSMSRSPLSCDTSGRPTFVATQPGKKPIPAGIMMAAWRSLLSKEYLLAVGLISSHWPCSLPRHWRQRPQQRRAVVVGHRWRHAPACCLLPPCRHLRCWQRRLLLLLLLLAAALGGHSRL